mmetsp:Transcript_818/g.2048  ORF Transcript_818/g.2048 Transcript_818/m.2048 type:complete len:967 (+) Transcript_818:119-3019(+)
MPKIAPQFPVCSVCLAVCAAVAHVIALGGNLSTVASMESLGKSTDGWSSVGTGLAGGLRTELDQALSLVAEGMTMTVEAWNSANQHLGEVHTVGQALQVPSSNATARAELTAAATKITQDLGDSLKKVLKAIKPVLAQVQKWLATFGEKLQHAIEDFSVGLDIAQKIFDSVMAAFKGGDHAEEEMLRHTYELFDVSNTGYISLGDLKSVSDIFHIQALKGGKAEELFKIYNSNGDQRIDRDEFARLVSDDSIPGAMSAVLRAYARRLAAAAGEVASAKTRDEAARGVADYLMVVCSKNLTKVSWVAQAFVNESLPLEFTAAVLSQLALAREAPGQMTTSDVGQTVVNYMVAMDPEQVAKAVKTAADAEFWENEGLYPEDQPAVAKQVASWASKAASKAKAGKSLLQFLPSLVGALEVVEAEEEGALLQLIRLQKDPASASCGNGNANDAAPAPKRASCGRFCGDEAPDAPPEALNEEGDEEIFFQSAQRRKVLQSSWEDINTLSDLAEDVDEQLHRAVLAQLEALPDAAKAAAHDSRKKLDKQKRVARAYKRQMAADVHRMSQAVAGLSSKLPFGVLAEDPEAGRVLKASVPARPETLRFASWLAANASSVARERQELCFNFSVHTSETVDSAARLVSKVVKRLKNVLNALEEYATVQSIGRLEKAIDDTVGTLDNVSSALASHGQAGHKPVTLPVSLEQLGAQWAKAEPILAPLVTQLPTAVTDLRMARKRVAGTSSSLELLFGVMGDKAPPIFWNAGSLYKTVSILYFVVFFLLTIGFLYHSFYASGYLGKLGHEDQAAAADYEPPRSLLDKLRVCFASCCSCISRAEDAESCFWAVILTLEVLWLVMFVVVFALLITAGVRAFVALGCRPVYILGDEVPCTEALVSVSKWLGTEHWITGSAIASACGEKDLLVCNIIGQRLGTSMMLACMGDLVAAILSFWLLVESASLHERRRWLLMLEKEE